MTNEKVLCLRTCASDMTSYGGFKWPKKGTVEAPDWKPTVECGNGLHGLLWGEGDGNLLSFAEDAVWLVFEADGGSLVDLGAKVKVPSAKVVKTGSRDAVTSWLAERAPGRSIVGVTATAGYAGTATAGDRGTATAGYAGTATAGYAGTATAGDAGTATAGYRGTATTAGYRGTATAGYRGTATAGDAGTATAGYRGTATAGDEGLLIIKRWNGKRYRWTTGEIGEDKDAYGKTLEPNVAYQLNDDGLFVRKSA